MRCFRTRPSFAWLALITLALHGALSFGHVHLDGIEQEAPAADAAQACEAPSHQQCPPPAHHSDTCAICWKMTIAGSAVIPAPPAIPVASVAHAIHAPDRDASLVAASVPSHFHARGPPHEVAL
jgi:hypothetical protein